MISVNADQRVSAAFFTLFYLISTQQLSKRKLYAFEGFAVIAWIKLLLEKEGWLTIMRSYSNKISPINS